MAALNTLRERLSRMLRTFEGAPATAFSEERQLERAVLNCLLWEDQFYEDGATVAGRIAALVPQVMPSKVAALAIRAREQMKLRHVPLLLVREMVRHKSHRALVGKTLARVVQRPDEMTEFLAIYWKDALGPLQQRRKEKLAKQVKLGLAEAFGKFDAYQLAKYDRNGPVRLKDVLFMVHAKPANDDQRAVWKRLIDGELAPPDTWEVALSGGADKRETWLRLLGERKLGGLALLRNLRNMLAVGVPEEAVAEAIDKMKVDRVLPYRFVAAARHGPVLEGALERAMFRALGPVGRLPGKWRLLVDVSGSMDAKLSRGSEMTRLEAACALAMLAKELCATIEIYTFSNRLVRVADRRGFALRDAIVASQPHDGTALGAAVVAVDSLDAHTLVLTDEQSCSPVRAPAGIGYMVNVASAQNGVGGDEWRRIDGFSERIFEWIAQDSLGAHKR